MKSTNNLFGTDWIEQFKLWNSPISSFCQEIKGFTNDRVIGLMSKVFTNNPRDRGSIPGRVIPKTQKMVLVLYIDPQPSCQSRDAPV